MGEAPKEGRVYVMVNPAMPGVRIGRTFKDPVVRAEELSKKGKTPYVAVYSRAFPNSERALQLIQARFSERRIPEMRDIYDVAVADVIGYIRSLSDDLATETPVQGPLDTPIVNENDYGAPIVISGVAVLVFLALLGIVWTIVFLAKGLGGS